MYGNGDDGISQKTDQLQGYFIVRNANADRFFVFKRIWQGFAPWQNKSIRPRQGSFQNLERLGVDLFYVV